MKTLSIIILCLVCVLYTSCSSKEEQVTYHSLITEKDQFIEKYGNIPLDKWTNKLVDSMFIHLMSDKNKFGTKEIITPFQRIDSALGTFKRDTSWFHHYAGKNQKRTKEFVLSKDDRKNMFCMVYDDETDQLLYLYFINGEDSLVGRVGLDIVWNEYQTVTFHSILEYTPKYKRDLSRLKKDAFVYLELLKYVITIEKETSASDILYCTSKIGEIRYLIESTNPFKSNTEAEIQYYVNYQMKRFALSKIGERAEQEGSNLATKFYQLSPAEQEKEMQKKVKTVITWLSEM